MAREGDYPTTFIPGLIRAGMSATQGLRTFRQQGGAIRDATWYKSWGQVVSALSKEADASTTPLNRRPDRSIISEWDAKGKSKYLYQVEAQIRFKGTDEVAIKAVSFRTNRLVSTGRAIQGALDFLVDNEDHYGEVVLGGILTGVYEFTGE